MALQDEVHKIDKNVVELQAEVRSLKETVKELVTKTEFAPVKLIVYGLATAVMSTVLMAIVSKVTIQ